MDKMWALSDTVIVEERTMLVISDLDLFCLEKQTKKKFLYEVFIRASLVAQWQRICLPMHETPIWSLIREDPTCCGATKPMCLEKRGIKKERERKKVFIIFFLATSHDMQDLTSPSRESNPSPLQWKCRVLTTGPPGKPPYMLLIIYIDPEILSL